MNLASETQFTLLSCACASTCAAGSELQCETDPNEKEPNSLRIISISTEADCEFFWLKLVGNYILTEVHENLMEILKHIKYF